MQVAVLAQDPYFARVRVTLPDGQDLEVVVNYLPTLVENQYRLFVDGSLGERSVVRTDVTVTTPRDLYTRPVASPAESMADYMARVRSDADTPR